MNLKFRAKAVSEVSEFAYSRGAFLLRNPNGTIKRVNCVEEMKRMAKAVEILMEVIEQEREECCGGNISRCDDCAKNNPGPCVIRDAIDKAEAMFCGEE